MHTRRTHTHTHTHENKKLLLVSWKVGKSGAGLAPSTRFRKKKKTYNLPLFFTLPVFYLHFDIPVFKRLFYGDV